MSVATQAMTVRSTFEKLLKHNDRDMRKWIGREDNFRLLFEKPKKEAEKFCEDGKANANVIGSDLKYMSSWLTGQAVVDALDGGSTWRTLCLTSARFRLADVRIRFANFDAKGRPRINPSTWREAFFLGLSEALFEEAESVGALAVNHLRTGAFMGLDTSGLETFALHLFCEWQGLDKPFEGLPLRPLGPYEALLANWRAEDPEALVPGVIAAADYHVARSREHTKKETFEFADEFFQLYPAEILAVYRLREQAGRANPEVDHPLFSTPLGRLQAIVPPEPDPLLEGVLNRAKEQLPTLR